MTWSCPGAVRTKSKETGTREILPASTLIYGSARHFSTISNQHLERSTFGVRSRRQGQLRFGTTGGREKDTSGRRKGGPPAESPSAGSVLGKLLLKTSVIPLIRYNSMIPVEGISLSPGRRRHPVGLRSRSSVWGGFVVKIVDTPRRLWPHFRGPRTGGKPPCREDAG